MELKLIALAVGGMFAVPAVASAADGTSSSIQIFGALYLEYSYSSSRGQAGSASGAPAGEFVSVDMLQTPDSEIGIKGEEALGGGYAAWFQCASTADVRGSGTAGFCSRNSAIGVKGAFGNIYAGNWDSPWKRTVPAVRIVNSTGIFGASPILFANSQTLDDNASPTVWYRRQNNVVAYDTPVWNGVQMYAMASTPSTAIGATTNLSGAKPRLYSVAASYSNGPLVLIAGYEIHQNFKVGAPVNGNYGSTDTGYVLGAAYMFGPVKVGVLYTKQKMDGGDGTDANVSAWGIAGEWTVSGSHGFRAGYDRANNTTGSFVAGPGSTLLPSSNRVFNGGAGNTGGTLWQIVYVFKASKRTELTGGYVEVRNESNARYSLSGLPAPAAGQNQSAVAVSMKHLF
jgi:predicted porin